MNTLTRVVMLPIKSQRRVVARLTMHAHHRSGDHLYTPWLGN